MVEIISFRMRRLYLTNQLPDTTLIAKRTAPDIKQKLEAYRKDLNDFTNVTPTIRPIQMSKYDDISKAPKEPISSSERVKKIAAIGGDDSEGEEDDEEGEDEEPYHDVDNWMSALTRLPKHSQVRGRKLLPHLMKINIGNLTPYDLLYDLVVPKVLKLKSTNREVLGSITQQLIKNSLVDKRLFFRKLETGAAKRETQKQKQSRTSVTGIQSKRRKSTGGAIPTRRYFSSGGADVSFPSLNDRVEASGITKKRKQPHSHLWV